VRIFKALNLSMLAMKFDLDLIDYMDEDESGLRYIFGSHEEFIDIWECFKVTIDVVNA